MTDSASSFASLRPIFCSAFLIAATALTACGSSSNHAKGTTAASSTARTSSVAASPSASSTTAEALPPESEPSAAALSKPVATVGSKTITLGQVRRLMRIYGQEAPPQAPQYTACVANLRASGIKGSDGFLKEECKARYAKLLREGVNGTIEDAWVRGEDAELGIKLDRAAVAHTIAQSEALPQFKESLQSSGQTLAQFKERVEGQELSNQLYKYIEAHTPKVTHALLARYYAQHQQSFALPERRDIHIVRTSSKVAAQQALSQIRAGRSFASILPEVSPSQPIGSKNGLILGLTPSSFSQKNLIDAIFKAPVHVPSGPVAAIEHTISLGYYVFEVIRVHPPREQTLAEVEGALRQELPEQLHDQSLSAFVKAFKAKWTARTSCQPGYVFVDCRQFGAQGRVEATDPYTL
jgi:hypothetical protein